MNQDTPIIINVVVALSIPFLPFGLMLFIAAFFANNDAEKLKQTIKESLNIIFQGIQVAGLITFGVYSLSLFSHIFPVEKQVSAIYLCCFAIISVACLCPKKLDFVIIKERVFQS